MIEQVAIAFTGVTAIWLTQSKSAKARKFACIFGLIGQPFWFWSAISAEQWGIVVLCCFYTFAWARGVRNNWFKDTAIAGAAGELVVPHPLETNQVVSQNQPDLRNKK